MDCLCGVVASLPTVAMVSRSSRVYVLLFNDSDAAPAINMGLLALVLALSLELLSLFSPTFAFKDAISIGIKFTVANN